MIGNTIFLKVQISAYLLIYRIFTCWGSCDGTSPEVIIRPNEQSGLFNLGNCVTQTTLQFSWTGTSIDNCQFTQTFLVLSRSFLVQFLHLHLNGIARYDYILVTTTYTFDKVSKSSTQWDEDITIYLTHFYYCKTGVACGTGCCSNKCCQNKYC
jgi:hypothetical protein